MNLSLIFKGPQQKFQQISYPRTPFGQPRKTLKQRRQNFCSETAVHSPDYYDDLSKTRTLLDHKTIYVKKDVQLFTNMLSLVPPLRYSISDENQEEIGSIEEEDSFGLFFKRHLMRTRRPSTFNVIDLHGQHLLKIHKPFYFLESSTFAQLPSGELIGEVFQSFVPLKKCYDLFLNKKQVMALDSPRIISTYKGTDEHGNLLATIERPLNLSVVLTNYWTVTFVENLGLDERALVIAAVIALDRDHHSHRR